VQQLETYRSDLKERDQLLTRLKVKAPTLVNELIASFDDPVWDARLPVFNKAWNWARADRWLEKLYDRNALEQAARQLQTIRKNIDATMGNLAAARAWRHCFQRMTESERQGLMAWMAAMRRIGKGTGKHAPAHRREARRHMDDCRSAIPAWIMPIYRVAESWSCPPSVDTRSLGT
jgi:hypothetical protein